MQYQHVFQLLLVHYGPQNWWPGDSPFEVMVGAILTQNTAWTNVEKAIYQLKEADHLDPAKIVEVDIQRLAEWIRPSGYFNIKAKRLRNFCRWYIDQGGLIALEGWDDKTLRKGLLSVNGIGPETADDMMLYAFGRSIFVVDAYTRRLFSRLGVMPDDLTYHEVQALFHRHLTADVELYNEYHALIVIHCKDICKKNPRCEQCCLDEICLRKGLR